MFLRASTRMKDGKTHRYWSVVENRRLADGRVLQRLPAHRVFWFGWNAQFPNTRLIK